MRLQAPLQVPPECRRQNLKRPLTLALVGCLFVWLNVLQNQQRTFKLGTDAELPAGSETEKAYAALQNENLVLKTDLEGSRAALLKQRRQLRQENEAAQDQALQKELDAAKKELEALKKVVRDSKGTSDEKEVTPEIETSAGANAEDAQKKNSSHPTKLIIKPVPQENCQPAWTTPRENTPEELQKIWDVTVPFCNETTAALYTKIYYAGYRNQIMSFSALVMTAMKEGHKQILLETIFHKDTYGSNKKNPHEALFDVAHWNSFYPQLPRLVHCDPNLMIDYSCAKDGSYSGKFDKIPDHDMPHQYKTFGNQHFGAYKRYTKRTGLLANPFPNPADVLIKSGALRPHPDLRAIQDKLLKQLNAPKDNYMALHPRVEPDMQKHPVCREKKVYNLTSIVQFLESEWKDPPVEAVYVTINREYLEREGVVENYKKGEAINWIAVNNLNELNRISKEGLWGGRVNVFEYGVKALNGTKYADRMWSIGGSILGFETATNAKIFVGAEISSFSTDIVSSRFYRGNLNNYYYRPDGLHRVTDESSNGPPAFVC